MRAMKTREISVEDGLGERLSSFLDGEMSEKDIARLSAHLETDRVARAQFARYAQISAHLGGDGYARVDASDIAARVSETLVDEPTVLAPRQWRDALRVPRLALGAALAAGVAVLAVAIAPQIVGGYKPSALPQAETFAFTPRMSIPADGLRTVSLQANPDQMKARRPVSAPAAETGHWRILEPAMREKLGRYLLEHNEVAGRISAQQPSAYVNFVSAPNVPR